MSFCRGDRAQESFVHSAACGVQCSDALITYFIWPENGLSGRFMALFVSISFRNSGTASGLRLRRKLIQIFDPANERTNIVGHEHGSSSVSSISAFSAISAGCEFFTYLSFRLIFIIITGSAVALHCCKAHSKSIGKMENSTPCKIVTPENFALKLGTRDYIQNITHYTNFHVHRFSGGFSTNR